MSQYFKLTVKTLIGQETLIQNKNVIKDDSIEWSDHMILPCGYFKRKRPHLKFKMSALQSLIPCGIRYPHCFWLLIAWLLMNNKLLPLTYPAHLLGKKLKLNSFL